MQKIKHYIHAEYVKVFFSFSTVLPSFKKSEEVSYETLHQPCTKGYHTQHNSSMCNRAVFYLLKVPRLGGMVKTAINLELEDLSSSPTSVI